MQLMAGLCTLIEGTCPAISYVAVRCTAEPLLHAAPQCAPKPEGDTYKFTHFAHKLMASKGINPLLSDSRRRKDRLALQVRLRVAALCTAKQASQLASTIVIARVSFQLDQTPLHTHACHLRPLRDGCAVE